MGGDLEGTERLEIALLSQESGLTQVWAAQQRRPDKKADMSRTQMPMWWDQPGSQERFPHLQDGLSELK